MQPHRSVNGSTKHSRPGSPGLPVVPSGEQLVALELELVLEPSAELLEPSAELLELEAPELVDRSIGSDDVGHGMGVPSSPGPEPSEPGVEGSAGPQAHARMKKTVGGRIGE
jgi:hypothetical protein